MAITSYRFVSPGVQVQEIDESQLPNTSNLVGPTIIGRFQRGPANRPVYITSKSQLIQTFGNPVPGKSGDDVWRDGNTIGTMYAGYAAQAWLTNTPAVNIIRLLGTQSPSATSDGKAGWETTQTYGTTDSKGGAYGLFVIPSSSAGSAVTGTLAAIWYMDAGSITLSGVLAGTENAGSPTYISGTNVLVKSNSGYSEFYATVTTANGTYSSNFNFNVDSDKYIRKVFNTNPILVNSTITAPSNVEYYWLGESYERNLDEIVGLGSTTTYAFIAPLVSGTVSYAKFRSPTRPAETGWIIGQDLTSNTGSFNPAAQQKLFKFVGLDNGEWAQQNLKISIADVKPPATDFDDYGTFSVQVRMATDSDNNVSVVEQYTNVNLNPVSPNYIARKIGDKYVAWDDTEKRLKEYGTYTNVSKHIRIEMDADVDAGAIDPTYLPFGFFGPPRPKSFTVTSGSATAAPSNTVVSGGLVRAVSAGNFLYTAANLTASVKFPAIPLRISASAGAISPPTNAYFGITTGEKTAYTTYDYSYVDMTRAFSSTFGDDAYDLADSETNREHSFIFTLDDISGSTSSGVGYVYVSGSRALGTSITAVNGGYRAILTGSGASYNRFTMPLYNGFDGFDIKEADPLRNTLLTTGTPTEKTSYQYYTINRAIDTISDPETLVTDLVSIPGLTYESLTTKLVQTCEARADALAIIDLPNVYLPEQESYYQSRTSRYAGTARQAAADLKSRGLNSSYGACYYPWVQIRDTINDQLVFVPPSIVALGAMSYGQRTQELWFAPAGFTRGGLTEGRGGIPVIGVTQRLSSTDRDTLYEANINPIAQFPAEGIVVFGQKTLQVTPSALDRINVRRLLIYLKREVSRIAATILFDQNVDVTWSRFLGQVNPFLASVKSRLGLSDYRVILDSTTTTPDLVDRNIMYAKIFLKPARAIEFIAIDFTITDSGASFAD